MWRGKLSLLLLIGLILLACWRQNHQGPASALVQKPLHKGQVADLTFPASDVLAGLPGVVAVEHSVRCNNPTRRVIHIRDWHLVPRDLYAADLRTSAGRPLSDDEVDRLHAELLIEVEAVQKEQMAILRCLIRHNGLRKVYSEGLTPRGMGNYKVQVKVLREMENDQIPALMRQLADVRGLLVEMKGREATDRYKKATAIEGELQGMLQDHKTRMLELGAAGRLLIAGDLEGVLPLDDDDALEASRPDGRVKLDKVKVRMREEAQVRLILAGDPVAVIVLGGNHDLRQPLRSLSGERVEYFRLTTSVYRRLVEP